MVPALLVALVLVWLLAALFENGPTWPAVVITALILWAVLSLGQASAMATPPSLLTPAPPNYRIVAGPPPFAPGQEAFPVAVDVTTGTIYHDGPLGKFDKAHEVGHLLDVQVLTEGDRRYFQRLMHAPPGAWDSGTGSKGYGSPSEWFADYFAAAATQLDLGRRNVGSYAQLGPKRIARFAKALDRFGRRHALLPYAP